MSWTDERVELLRKLWLEDFSASKIAAQLGNGITPNAVIGKVHRLGLSGRVKPPAPSQPRQRSKPAQSVPQQIATPKTTTPRSNDSAVRKTLPVFISLHTEAGTAAIIPFAERVIMEQLREAMCRWPFGDPTTTEFRYCGTKSPAGSSYCTYHARLAYQPELERRRDREKRLQRERGIHAAHA